jgi:hypothetical protein
MFCYRLRTLCLVVAIVPPILASCYLEPIVTAAVVCYFGTIATILPTAAFLWRNSASRGG